ncbi:MAG: hypothetical protein IJ190_08650 [Prevotella sp.]|nr:hypothetical protein [Prevotella sp.]
MKRIKIMFALVAVMFAMGAQAQKQALLVGYSQTDNVYEDENIRAELVRLSLKITNKTNKPIFVDRSSSFYYVNDDAVCLDEKRDDTQKNYQPLAPKSDTWVSTLINPIRGKYDAGGGSGRRGGKAKYQTDLQLQVMNYMETMRYELANNQKKSCTNIHLTGDESFMKVKVYIRYDLERYFPESKKEREDHTFTLSTWVSDMILSKYYIQDQDKVKRTNAVNIQGRMTDIMHVFADTPFEYDEDNSPLDIYLADFDKGRFNIYRLGASDAEKEGKPEKGDTPKGRDKKGGQEEMKSNFEERSKVRQVLVWEGESTNWVQALQDSYERYLVEDGLKPKKAHDEAKDFAKKQKGLQTLKP